jgi:hypothetical protein
MSGWTRGCDEKILLMRGALHRGITDFLKADDIESKLTTSMEHFRKLSSEPEANVESCYA